MPKISLTNSKKRDATVYAESVRVVRTVYWSDHEGRIATSTKLLKSTISHDFDALLEQHGSPDKVGEALIAGDPEIDLENVGRYLRDTQRVFVNSDRQVVFGVDQIEVIRNPDGTEKGRRKKLLNLPNVGEEMPIPWGRVLIPKDEFVRKFVVLGKVQLFHVNGLTYDFLYDIAKELEEKKSVLRLGAGPKGNEQLVLRRGATKYFGFLEGRTQGSKYLLLLHLTNIELKAPEEPKPETEGGAV
jgi:hypothetical protein